MSAILATILVSCVTAQDAASPPQPSVTTIDLSRYFKGHDGCFVVLNTKTNRMTRYNPKRCAERFSPCSTFKIPNSLIGLETGVVEGPEHEFKWDGKKRWRKECNRDHTLRSAIKHSVVWYYQAIASQVGDKKMNDWLARLNYGNRDTSAGLTQFWLGSSLKISANEQVDFLRMLQSNRLSASKKSQRIVRNIMIAEKTPTYTLRGKTGTHGQDGKMVLGWYVGTVENADTTIVFACNISAKDKASGRVARRISKKILAEMGVIDSKSDKKTRKHEATKAKNP